MSGRWVSTELQSVPSLALYDAVGVVMGGRLLKKGLETLCRSGVL